MDLFDTHCHIHSSDYPLNADEVIEAAKKDNVSRLLCVGTSLEDSEVAVIFVSNRPGTWASIGIHPHEAKDYIDDKTKLKTFSNLVKKPKVVAVGECGLDYFYNHSSKKDQKKILEHQLQLALDNNLPVIFHVREAFDDFWPIFNNFKGLRGVIHSFSASAKDVETILSHNLYIGLNGIMTFTKNADQTFAATKIPLSSLVLETDSPFLTPRPLRGKVNEPKYVRHTAEFLANLRGESLEVLSNATTNNAKAIFKVD